MPDPGSVPPAFAGSAPSPTPSPSATNRRGFLRWIVSGIRAIIAAMLGIPAVAYVAGSGQQSRPRREFYRVAKLSEILQQGKVSPDTGKRVYGAAVRHTRRDAWTVYPNEVLGRVWLVFDPNASLDPKNPEPTLVAFTAVCPHLGCTIGYDAEGARFICPCHAGVFGLSGEVLEGPPPRPMDRLEVRLVQDKASPPNQPDYFVEVRYQEFLPEQPEAIPKA